MWSAISEKPKQDRPSGCCKCNYILTINRPGSQRTFLYKAHQTVFSLPGKSLRYEIITRENAIYKDDNYPQVHLQYIVFAFEKVRPGGDVYIPPQLLSLLIPGEIQMKTWQKSSAEFFSSLMEFPPSFSWAIQKDGTSSPALRAALPVPALDLKCFKIWLNKSQFTWFYLLLFRQHL